jgi:NAD(P)H-hydrate epimerase
MDPLPAEVYSAASVRAMDRRAIEGGISGYELMQRAGDAALASVRRHWPAARSIVVMCGPGNNGGDGYVVARRARAAGLEVRVIAVSDPRRLHGDAERAHADFAADGGSTEQPRPEALAGCELVVDALLGTGVDRPLEEPFVAAIRQMNRAEVPVFALDMPSGLDADSGWPHGVAVRATRTIAFLGLKRGYYLGAAPDHVGIVDFAGLDVPAGAVAGESPAMRRIGGHVASRVLLPRERSAHKGSHGRVVIVGGHAMPGAARLAGEAALRAGAGLVMVVTGSKSLPAIVAGRPELIARADDALVQLRGLLSDPQGPVTHVAVGPGLGTQDSAREAMDAALEIGDSWVLDADALSLLATQPRRWDRWILTPHPGEAARLLDATSAEVQRDRLGAVRDVVSRFGGTCVLKGANTLVCGTEGEVWVCDRGNPGMATAGSGDVLTGVIAALHAPTPTMAAAAGAFLHAEAGDRAARGGMRGMIASDIIAELRGVVNHPWS